MITKWEYYVFNLSVANSGNLDLDIAYGKDINSFATEEGWELITVDNGMAYFKREIITPNIFINGIPIEEVHKND